MSTETIEIRIIWGYFSYPADREEGSTETRLGETRQSVLAGTSLGSARSAATRIVKGDSAMQAFLLKHLHPGYRRENYDEFCAGQGPLITAADVRKRHAFIWDNAGYKGQGWRASEWRNPSDSSIVPGMRITTKWCYVDRRAWHLIPFSLRQQDADALARQAQIDAQPELHAFYGVAYPVGMLNET